MENVPRIRLSVFIIDEGDGVYSAFCGELEGCMTQAKSLEEVKANIIEAIKLNLEHLRATGQEIPTLPLEADSNNLLLEDIEPSAPLAAKFAELDAKMHQSHRYDIVLA